MVGIVIVSHSKKLAHEIIELCNEMKKYDFPVINGSGTTGNHLGSDPMIIKEAIENAYSEDGLMFGGPAEACEGRASTARATVADASGGRRKGR